MSKKELEDSEPCKLAKAKRTISRNSPSSKEIRPFYRIYVDLFSLPSSYNGKKVALLIKDDFTKIIFLYPLSNSTSSELIKCFHSLRNYLMNQFSLNICIFHRDNNVSLQRENQEFIIQYGIKDEPTAPYMLAQNGSAERSRDVISTEARTMRLSSKFPEFLWPEIWKTAVFIYNRIPHHDPKADAHEAWRSPLERLYRWLKKNQKHTPSLSLNLSHLRAYRCKAYPLTSKSLKNKEKKDLKLKAHADIGYLVGYDSTNIFRIYILSRREVQRIRDVTFIEKHIFAEKEITSNLTTLPELDFSPHIPEES